MPPYKKETKEERKIEKWVIRMIIYTQTRHPPVLT